jgi:hypothetical protein
LEAEVTDTDDKLDKKLENILAGIEKLDEPIGWLVL